MDITIRWSVYYDGDISNVSEDSRCLTCNHKNHCNVFSIQEIMLSYPHTQAMRPETALSHTSIQEMKFNTALAGAPVMHKTVSMEDMLISVSEELVYTTSSVVL